MGLNFSETLLTKGGECFVPFPGDETSLEKGKG